MKPLFALLCIGGVIALGYGLFYGYAMLNADQYVRPGQLINEGKRQSHLMVAGFGVVSGLLMLGFGLFGLSRGSGGTGKAAVAHLGAPEAASTPSSKQSFPWVWVVIGFVALLPLLWLFGMLR